MASTPFAGLMTCKNQHRFQSSFRNGFRWWDGDVTYCGLKLLVRSPDIKAPSAVLRNTSVPQDGQRPFSSGKTRV
jgi:hypothetical protein